MSELNLTAVQVQDLINKMKLGMATGVGQLETMPKSVFLNNLRMIDKVLNVTGIKLQSYKGNEITVEELIEQLRLGPALVFEIHFPDGDKYETITRWRQGDNHISTFCRRV